MKTLATLALIAAVFSLSSCKTCSTCSKKECTHAGASCCGGKKSADCKTCKH